MTIPLDRRTLLALGAGAGAALIVRPALAEANGDPIVRIRSGWVRGRTAGDIQVFTGIPYGRAARFAAPVATEPWNGVLDATRPAAVAPQADGPIALAGTESEDCLQLNVWAPAMPGPHPVMVFIHGGSNETGWSGDAIISGERFAADGIVCVTVNYRLGALGFAEMGELLGPNYVGSSNNAMRDLLLSLGWVRANIAAFGGDPSRVTIAGESAGGKNVGTLLGMPRADGLYAQAAIFSGGAQTVATPNEARAFAALVAQRLGGADRLLTVAANLIVAAQEAAKAAWPGNFPFRPVVDGSILPEVPLARIEAGIAPRVRLLIGSNADESRLFLPASLAALPLTRKSLANETPARVAALDLIYARLFPTLSPAERHWRLLTAEEYGMPCLRVAEGHAARGGEVFRYRLAYPAPGGPFAGTTPHALDVPLTFDHVGAPGLGAFFGLSRRDQPLANILHGCVARFVVGRTPAASGVPSWLGYEPARRMTMVMGPTVSMVADPDRMERLAWAEG